MARSDDDSKRHFATARTASPLWNRALERYREELEETDDYEDIIGTRSLEDLVNYAKSIEPVVPLERNALNSMNRLGPILRYVDDFSAVIAVCFGADAKLTAFVWGSIRLILTLAASAGETLQNVLDMLEELSLTLPRFRHYEKTLPLDNRFEVALLEVYTEVICFYARSIHFFRANPHLLLRRATWSNYHEDFERTLKRITHLSSAVESEADLARMRAEKEKYGEVLELLKAFKDNKITETSVIHCYHIPKNPNPRFWGREECLEAVARALDPGDAVSTSLKSFAVYGMGGVGKTQIALAYASNSKKSYEVILFIAADTSISLEQSFREVAQILGLVLSDEEAQDGLAAILKVKSWLTESNCRWLLIFDNADNLDILQQAWPGNARGSILITSRDFNAAYNPASDGLHIQPFDDKTGSEALLHRIGLDKTSESNKKEAAAITRALGGLPLALTQIGGFISQRKIPLRDFLPLYERNAAKIDSKRTGISDYEHTLSTVWAMSLANLSGPASHLQMLLAFFDPDSIHEVVLIEGSKLLEDPDLAFLQDEFDLGDAEEVLLQAALIGKNADDGVLSIHRLVQAAVIRELNEGARKKYFDAAVRTLTWGFPDTWSKDIGHQFQAWTKCEKCLPHVNFLVKQAQRYQITASDSEVYGELLLRCSWYLYEREYYELARSFANTALETFPDKASLAFASATDLVGLIDLDMAQPEKALENFEAALRIRKIRLGDEDSFIAYSFNNLALAYTEIPKLEEAYKTHKQAIEMRLRMNSDRVGNSYSNMCSLLLRMGKPDEAEEMLTRCPGLKDLTDETFLNTGNPRWVGDMVVLSRIRMAQGRPEDALRLASKALDFRQRANGGRLKTCDSLYDVACLLHHQGKSATATEFLVNLIAIAEALPEGQGQLARACYKLCVVYADLGRDAEADKQKARALEIRARLRPEDKDAACDDAGFQKLVLWMLW